jgi:hypothetical protein
MDMRKYGTGFIKPDDVRDGPRQETIIAVLVDEKYDRLILELSSGDQFALNKTNTRALAKQYGWESKDLIGKTIELSLGTYKDWNTDPVEEKETVIAKPISAPSTSSGTKTMQPMKRTSVADDLNDEIPF